MIALLFAAIAAPLTATGTATETAAELEAFARDSANAPTDRVEAALRALELGRMQRLNNATDRLIAEMFDQQLDCDPTEVATTSPSQAESSTERAPTAEPASSPATPRAQVALTSLEVRAVGQDLRIEARTESAVRALHYLHERGDDRKWILWLDGVTADATRLQPDGEVVAGISIVPRAGVTAVVAEIAPGSTPTVRIEQLDAGWSMTIVGAVPAS